MHVSSNTFFCQIEKMKMFCLSLVILYVPVNILGTRAHPAISHYSHLLLKKCRVATNIIYWLKVKKTHSSLGGSKITYLRKRLFRSAFGFSNSCTLYHCPIFNSLNAGFFQYHQGVKQLGSRSGPTICWA